MLKVFRKELKYVMPISSFCLLKSKLDKILERDLYANDGEYLVRSLYFDSIFDNDLYDVKDGLMEKRKIRLRIYSYRDEKIKLEYKCKSGSDGKKYSIIINRAEAESMLRADYEFLRERSEPIAFEMYMRLVSGAYIPKSIVEYIRTAYTYPVSDIRITFDSQIKASMVPYGFFEENPLLYPIGETDKGILEIKYNDFLPTPLKSILKGVDALPTANSKYAEARLI